MRGSLLAVVLAAAPAQAQTVTIDQRVVVPVGRLTTVKANYDGDDFKYTADPQLDVFREYDPDPKVVVIRAIGYKEGVYQIKAVTCKGSKLSEFAVCTVVVGSPKPPDPTPVPPTPTPVPPDGEYGLVKASRDGYAKVTADRHLVDLLAAAQRAHASAVAAGAFKDAAAILDGWRAANNQAVSSSPTGKASWTAWGNVVSPRLQELYNAKKLTTNAEWAAAFREVATGLDGKP